MYHKYKEKESDPASLRCQACCQFAQAPYNPTDVNNEKLKQLYDLYVCQQCVTPIHFGCLDPDSETKIKVVQVLTLTKKDIEELDKKDLRVKVYEKCSSCANPTQ